MLTLDNVKLSELTFSTTQNSVYIIRENLQNYYKLAVVPLGQSGEQIDRTYSLNHIATTVVPLNAWRLCQVT